MGVERLEAFERRHRYHEVAAREADQSFHLALVVTLRRPAEAILEQVVRLQLREHARALTLTITQNAGHRDLRVVIEDRVRKAAEERKRLHMPVAESFCRLRRIGHNEAGIRVINASQIKEHMDVKGSDGKHVGTVLGLERGRIKIASGGMDHYIDIATVDAGE